MVRSHHRQIERIAIASDSPILRTLPRMAGFVLSPKVGVFGFDGMETALRLATPITENDASDYRYRAKARQADVADAMASLAASIDYSNFKDRAAKAQGRDRAHVYADVWQTLYALQSRKYEG